MEAGSEIPELCRVEGINPTQYGSWKKQLIDGADAVFGKRSGVEDSATIAESHEKDMNRMRAVIAAITAENLSLKRRFRDRDPRPFTARISEAGDCRSQLG